MKKFKLNLRKVTFSQISNYTIVIFISSILLSTIFLSIPRSEEILPKDIFKDQRYDLNIKEDKYWKKQYVLTFDDKNARKINETKDILFKRLKKLGVEEVQITNSKSQIKVVVQSTLDEPTVESLISTRGYMRIVTRKEGVDFDTNQIEIFFRKNYNDTEWTRHDFRNVYITKLLNNNQEKTYFALFKTWPDNTQGLSDFQKKYIGQTVGVAIDDFVTPISISSTNTKEFALGLGADENQANFYSILFNTGVIPIKYSMTDSKTLTPQVYDIDYIQTLLAITVVMVVISLYLLFTEPKEKRQSVWIYILTSLMSFSVLITYLKISYIPIDLFMIVFASILGILYLKITTLRQDEAWTIRLSGILVSILMIILGFGYITLLGYYLAIFIIISYILSKVSEQYIKAIKMTLLK